MRREIIIEPNTKNNQSSKGKTKNYLLLKMRNFNNIMDNNGLKLKDVRYEQKDKKKIVLI